MGNDEQKLYMHAIIGLQSLTGVKMGWSISELKRIPVDALVSYYENTLKAIEVQEAADTALFEAEKAATDPNMRLAITDPLAWLNVKAQGEKP